MAGYVAWIGQYAERNAVLVDILETLGAVLFVKTNVPQTLMVLHACDLAPNCVLNDVRSGQKLLITSSVEL